MPELLRFARRLAEQLGASAGGIHQTVSLDQVRGSILPYRVHRKALQFDSVEDYEMVLLRLASEERDFVKTLPAAAAERCRAELRQPNPDLGLLDELAGASLQIGAPALARIMGEEVGVEAAAPARAYELAGENEAPLSPPPPSFRPAPPPPRVEVAPPAPKPTPKAPPPAEPVAPVKPAPRPVPAAEMPRPKPAPKPVPQPEIPMASSSEPATQCRACKKPIPAGRVVVFCPWCGDRQIPFACGRCGTELDSAWQHCITCGAEVKDPYHFA